MSFNFRNEFYRLATRFVTRRLRLSQTLKTDQSQIALIGNFPDLTVSFMFKTAGELS